MAIHPRVIPPFPQPTKDQMTALQTASEYLHLAGTQAATFLLGCPQLDGDTVTLAAFSNSLLASAALCTGLLELAQEQARL